MQDKFYLITLGKRFVRDVKLIMVGNQARHAQRFETYGAAAKAWRSVCNRLKEVVQDDPKSRFKGKSVKVVCYQLSVVHEETL